MECNFDLIKSQNIKLNKNDLEESRNQYSLNNIDILTPKNQFNFQNNENLIKKYISIKQNSNDNEENKKITIYNPLDNSKKFSPTYKYWERRYKENEIKKENLKKVNFYKLLKELKERPKTSKNKEIEKFNKTGKKKKLTLADYMALKKKNVKNKRRYLFKK